MRISDWSSDVCSSDLANPDAGTLADREHREHRYTVRDLLADHHIRTYSDVRHYASQGDSRLEILANETDPATSEAFNEQDYLDALKTLEVHYIIIITDCGTGMMHSALKNGRPSCRESVCRSV